MEELKNTDKKELAQEKAWKEHHGKIVLFLEKILLAI